MPFDRGYQAQLLALIAGLTAFGLVPRSVLEFESRTAASRLHHIFELLRSCRYSLHDLSRVETKRGLPRFNMPFEAGIAFALELSGRRHNCYLLERERGVLARACGDLSGIDPQVHNGSAEGVLHCLLNLFGRARHDIRMPDLEEFHQILRREVRDMRREGMGPRGLFEPASFRRLVLGGQAAALALKNEIQPPRLGANP